MSEYTITFYSSGSKSGTGRALEEFDRWLRKVQAEAWEEGHRCDYIFDEDHVRFCGNPYL